LSESFFRVPSAITASMPSSSLAFSFASPLRRPIADGGRIRVSAFTLLGFGPGGWGGALLVAAGTTLSISPAGSCRP
jgi:hypothetical protein